MVESGTFRVLEVFTYKRFTFFTFFRFMLILISYLDSRANNTLSVISEVYHCNFHYIMKYDILFQLKIIICLQIIPVLLLPQSYPRGTTPSPQSTRYSKNGSESLL